MTALSMTQQLLKDLEYVIGVFSGTEVTGTILMVYTEAGFDNYTEAFGDPMKEGTLILGDKDNNIALCYQKHNTLSPKDRVLQGVDIIPCFKYSRECIVHKRQHPGPVPEHIVNIVYQNNTTNNITNNITNSFNKIGLGRQSCNSLGAGSTAHDFMSSHFAEGGMIPIKEVKKTSGWAEKYMEELTTKRVHMCISCGNRAHKGCCSGYSAYNRVMIKMVIGWSVRS